MTFESFLEFIGAKIAEVRRARELTQREVARQAGLSYRYFQTIETGAANMTLATLYKLARFLNVHISDFFPKKIERD